MNGDKSFVKLLLSHENVLPYMFQPNSADERSSINDRAESDEESVSTVEEKNKDNKPNASILNLAVACDKRDPDIIANLVKM